MANPQTGTGAGWSSDLSTALQLGAQAYGAYNASQLNSNADTIYKQSNPFGGYRPTYGAQLLSLIQNPSTVTSLPGYNFLLDQGIQAIDRSAAAPGGLGLGSGGEMMQLEKYGQGLADQFYSQQVATLAHLAGADISPANPYQALVGKGGAAGSLGSSIEGLSSAIPGGVNALASLVKNIGGLFKGSNSSGGDLNYSLGSSNSYDPTTGSGYYDPTQMGAFVPSGYNLDPTTGDLTQASTDPYSFDSGSYTPTFDTAGFDATGGGDTGGGMDLSGMFSSGFKPAGGEAATPSTNYMSDFGTGMDAYGVATGLASGKPMGYAGAAIDATKLAAKSGEFSASTSADLGSAAGYGAGVLGLYSGLKQGGVAGDTQAAMSAAGMATHAAVSSGAIGASAGAALGTALTGVGIEYAMYQLAQALDPLEMSPEDYTKQLMREESPQEAALSWQNFLMYGSPWGPPGTIVSGGRAGGERSVKPY